MHTKDKLAAALTEAGLPMMAEQAAKGYYDDWQSPLDMPITQLAEDLLRVRTEAALALYGRVIRGEFDGTNEEAEEWAASAEGQAAMRKLLEDK